MHNLGQGYLMKICQKKAKIHTLFNFFASENIDF